LGCKTVRYHSGLEVADPGPLGEEFGWRGFALPRFLNRWPPLQASLILGILWAALHLPAFFVPTLPQSRLWFPAFTLGVISISIFDTWIFLRTRANLLLAILVHAMANYCGSAVGASFPYFVALEGAGAAVIVLAGGLAPSRSTERRAVSAADRG